MLKPKGTYFWVLLFILFSGLPCRGEDAFPFKGKVNADKINIRCDSTVGAETICKVSRGESISVVSELYDWYKIQLPRQAPCYIKKALVELIVNNRNPALASSAPLNPKDSARVIKNRVNIRLAPSESAAIIGRANQGQMLVIISSAGDWYKIEPTDNSFGWVYKKFINRIGPLSSEDNPALKEDKMANAKTRVPPAAEGQPKVSLEGIVRPYGKFFKRAASHNLVTREKKVFLLKAEKKMLDPFNYKKAKVVGTLVDTPGQEYPIIEVQKLQPSS